MTTSTSPRFPETCVQLVGQDSNAGSIIGRVAQALRDAGASAEELAEFRSEAYSGDYDHLLRTCCEWVSVS